MGAGCYGLRELWTAYRVYAREPDDEGERSLHAHLRDRLDGRGFVVSDTTERGAAWRIATPGLVALFLAAVGVRVLALLLL